MRSGDSKRGGGRSLCRLLFLILIWTTTSSQWQCEAAIDCRRFVFAPICRGASAKRAQMAPLPPLNDRNLVRILDQFKNVRVRPMNEQRQIKEDDLVRTMLKKYWSSEGGLSS